MGLNELSSREAVLRAIRECDEMGQVAFLKEHHYKPARSYFLLYDGRLYDSKAIAGVAYGKQFPDREPLHSGSFSGGYATVEAKLRSLGFDFRIDNVRTHPNRESGVWLEMSRDVDHGGHGWAFTECLWSPTHRKTGGSWAYWELLREVRKGDTVLHLRGQGRAAAFVGFSTADADGAVSKLAPPKPGQWGHAQTFYRVPLVGFVPFSEPVSLNAVFAAHEKELRAYFEQNRSRSGQEKELLFYVAQAGRLQCQNGAYLSEVSARLASAMFGEGFDRPEMRDSTGVVSAQTGVQLAQVAIRIGQRRFSENVRSNYGGRCCFPGCSIGEGALLVGSHIARWADAEGLRGDTANGLCLCLLHDRSFELGYFTLTPDFRIATNRALVDASAWGSEHLVPRDGEAIRLGSIAPSVEALKLHWERIGFAPPK